MSGNVTFKFIPNLLSQGGRRTELWPLPDGAMTLRDLLGEHEWADGKHRYIHHRVGPFDQSSKHFSELILLDGDEVIVTPKVRLEFIAFVYFAFTVYSGIKQMRANKKAPTFGQDSGSGLHDNDSTYGWKGAITMADEGIPVPIVYGRTYVAGNVIDLYTKSVDDNGVLNLVIALSEGVVQSIAGVTSDIDAPAWKEIQTYAVDALVMYYGKVYRALVETVGEEPGGATTGSWDEEFDLSGKLDIEGNPIENYREVGVFIRLGNSEQERIPGFQFVHEQFDLSFSNLQLRHDVPYVYTSTNKDVDSFSLSFELPLGLYYIKRGKYHEWEIIILVEYREYGDTDWIYHGELVIREKTQSVIRRDYEIEFGPRGRYEVRLSRTTEDPISDPSITVGGIGDINLSSVDERRHDGLSYPFTALLGVEILATDQLSGSIPNIRALVEGVKVTDWNDVTAYSRNPLKILWDLFTNKRYGAGNYIEADNLDATSFAAGAAYCDVDIGTPSAPEVRFTLDIALGGKSRLLDWLQETCQGFRCMPVWIEGAIRPIIAKEETPGQKFGMGNIVKDSFKINYTSVKDQFNVVEVQFQDEENEYRRAAVYWNNAESLDANEPERIFSVFLPGITRRRHALRIARYLGLLSTRSTTVVSFRAGMDAVVSTPGDVVYVSHDVPQWGLYSGRLNGGAAGWVKLRENVTFAPATSYSVQVRHAADSSLETLPINMAAGAYVAGTQINVTGAFGIVPLDFDVYSIDVTGQTGAPYRIQEISRADDDTVEITAQLEDNEVYSEDDIIEPQANYSYLPDPRRMPESVEDLTASIIVSYHPGVSLSWRIVGSDVNFGFWDHAEIWMGRFDEDGRAHYEFHSIAQRTEVTLIDIVPGEQRRVKIVSVSRWGLREIFEGASTVDFTAQSPEAPANVRGLEISGNGNDPEFMGNDVLFAWTDISRETADEPAGEEPLGAGQGARDFWFQHFQVLMWDNLTGTGEIIRTEYVTSNMFRYTKEMNAEDHGRTPDRQFGISVKAVDIFNKKSPQHMAINVINYSPAEVINYNDALSPVETHWLHVLEFVAYSDGRFSVAWPEGTDIDRDGFVLHRQVNAADPTVFPKTAFVDEFDNTRYEPDDEDGAGNVLLWVKGQNTWFHDVIPVALSGDTLSFTLAAKDVFGDTGLRYSMHFVVDEDFDGTRDPVTFLWTGVTAYKW